MIRSIGTQTISAASAASQTDEIVGDVQRTLNLIRGYSALPENGVFDRQTESAIREFQHDQGIEGNGAINQATIDALNRRAATIQDQNNPAQPAPPMSEADRNRRVQELRIQEPAIRDTLTQQVSSGGEVYRTAADALLDPNPHTFQVHGHDFRVLGATDSEAASIRSSLERLPASHLDRVPPNILVADQLSNRRRSGGAQFPNDPQNPRIEVARESLRASASAIDRGREGVVNSTLLHEIGHVIGSGSYGNHSSVYSGAPYDRLQDIPADVPSDSRDPASRERIERFAQAYMMYFGGSDRRHPQGLTAEQREAMRTHFEAAGIPDNVD
jgi:peptidoglycan hydrolase-like protein with peptidoglycan-binding domain